jgi:hypothetical protein
MENEETGSISCIAVGDMLKRKLVLYTDALSNGASDSVISAIGDEIDKIEAVHEKCIAMGDVTDIGNNVYNANEVEIGSSTEEEGEIIEEEDAN